MVTGMPIGVFTCVATATGGRGAEPGLRQIGRKEQIGQAQARREPDDGVGAGDAEITDRDRPVEEQLDLERIRSSRAPTSGTPSHVATARSGELFPADRTAGRRVQVVEQGGDPRDAEVLRAYDLGVQLVSPPARVT